MNQLPGGWPFMGQLSGCRGLCALLLLFLLAACAPMPPAPVEDRGARPPASAPVASGPAPAIYQVRSGDTLYSIAFRYRLDWRDVAAWNRIDAPYLIRPGQELRLSPPPQAVARTEPAPVRPPTSAPAEAPVRTQPPPDRTAERPSSQPAPTAPAPVPETRAEAPPPARAPAPVTAGPSRQVAGIEWRWPTEGRIVRPFDPAATRRGIGIGGRAGQPVLATADGQVVYSGTALIGYGELIIIKHSDTMLSAYAHNRVRLVEEGAQVRAGQQIAEMGISDRNEELLHFEVRRNGQPENPLNFLPRR